MNRKALEKLSAQMVIARKQWGDNALALLESDNLGYGPVNVPAVSPSGPLWERKIFGLKIRIMPGSELTLRLEFQDMVATKALNPYQILELRSIVSALVRKFPREQGKQDGVYIGVKALLLCRDLKWPISPQRHTQWTGFQLEADAPPEMAGRGKVAPSFVPINFTTAQPGSVTVVPRLAPSGVAKGNSHGIYALWTGRKSLIVDPEISGYYKQDTAGHYADSRYTVTGRCIAVLQGHGRVVVGGRGFRAEKCLIKELYAEPRYAGHPVLKLAPQYGIIVKELERGHWKGAWSRNSDT